MNVGTTMTTTDEPMFTPERREQMRAMLLARARQDERIVGAAVTGSAAGDGEDRWSDIDLFFGVAPGVDPRATMHDWSSWVYAEFSAVHHFDLAAGATVYRAFLLPDLLEVDLGYAPAHAFGPIGPGPFRVVFGDPVERKRDPLDVAHVAGLVWHHVLHARISIERGTLWRAAYWIGSLRDNLLSLASHRHDLPIAYARGADRLPADISRAAEETLVTRLTTDELSRALTAATKAVLAELREHDAGLSETLQASLLRLTTATP